VATATSPSTTSAAVGPGRVENGSAIAPSAPARNSRPPSHRLAPGHAWPRSSTTSIASPAAVGRPARRRSPLRISARLARPPPISSMT
jgi:hypothetical protein